MIETDGSQQPRLSTKEEELDRTSQIRGFRYGTHDFMAETDLPGLRKLNDRVQSGYANKAASLLDRKIKEIVLLAANIAQGDSVAHLQVHLHAAHNAGASPEELLELLYLVKGWVTLPRIAVGMEAWRSMFRPDVPPVDRVSDLR